jgi:hypothetical protein
MFRVPTNLDHPTFDHTFKVGFIRWLKSTKAEREEWQRRRNAAAAKAKEGQDTRMEERTERKITEQEARKARRSNEEVVKKFSK